MAISRKITQTLTGEVTIFAGTEITSTKDGSTENFPALNIVQSVKNSDGDGYVNVQNVDLYPFASRNVEFAAALNLTPKSRTKMVGTITLNLVKPHVASNGKVYTKWEVASSTLVPSSDVPYANREATETAAAPATPAAAAAVPPAELPF